MQIDRIPIEVTRRLRNGDSDALAELFTMCQDRLRQMLHFRMDRRLLRRLDVDDVLQDAFIDAEKRLPHFGTSGNDASPYVWLRMVTLQTLQDAVRRHLGTQARSISREQGVMPAGASNRTTLSSMAHILVGQLTSPSQALQRAEAIEQVQLALKRMSPIDQEILALRHFEGLTNTETAEVLGVAAGTATLRYVRALKRLQTIMSQHIETGRCG